MRLRRPSLTYLYGVFLGVWLVVACPIWANQIAISLKGDWVDSALSEALSQKYGSPVKVHNAYFVNWHELRFGTFTIDSQEGNPLVRASSGVLRLLRLDLSAKGASETEIRFKDISFTRAYYNSTTAASKWRYFLKKPIHVKELCFLIRQNRARTKVEVTDCRSEGVRIAGSVEVARSGARKDDLRVSVSTWTALRSMF